MPFRPTIVASLIAIFCVAIPAATPAFAQDDDDTSLDDIPHVSIVGTAETEVAPDLATITLGVTTERPTATAAAEANARIMRAVLEAAKAQGIASADIATQSANLTQTFDEVRDPQGDVSRKPRGFAAENIVAIKVRDLAKAGAVAETLIAKGANRFDGIAFSVEHPEPVLAQLAGEAVRNARAQAQVAAQAAGVRLGRVLIIDPQGGQTTRPAGMMMRMAAPAMPVAVGTTKLSRSFAVTWALDAR